MQDNFTEVTSTGWFSRLGASIKGVVVGLVFFVAAFPVLFWNEGRTVKRMRVLESGASQVISVAIDAVDSGNEGKLVHLTGDAKTEEVLSDPDFGVAANAIKLVREAKMYQWEEETSSKTRKKIGGGEETVTEYKYKKGWSEKLINSSDFKHPEGHENPGSMPYESKDYTAQTVTVGAYTLSPGLVGKISTTVPLALNDETTAQMPEDVKKAVKLTSGSIYIGKDTAVPQIGDQQITFKVVKQPALVSIVAGQTASTFQPFPVKDDTIELLQMGSFTSDAMFQQAQKENKMWGWILRAVGFFMMMTGIGMIFKPLTVTADVIPFLGDMLGMGIGIFAAIISFALSLLTISIAWVFYRPLIGIPLLVISVGSIVAFKVLGKKKAMAK